MLLANPGLTQDQWRHNFKYYASLSLANQARRSAHGR